MRLCSALPVRPLRVLTTDAEFASFARQLAAWEDAGQSRVTRVAAEPFDSFAARWTLAARRGEHDLVYLSQVFYDSGLVSGRLDSLVEAIADERTEIVIDGYHAFMALPTDLAALAGRVHYLAGGYKYAMSGEGSCFLHSPPGRALRPLDTGWFADADTRAPLHYPADARRFMGATFDPTALYRFVAVHDWLHIEGVTPEAVHAHVGALQAHFLARLDGLRLPFDSLALSPPVGLPRGNFLSFVLNDAAATRQTLAAAGVVVDHRGQRLRIGFGIYHDAADIDTLLVRMAQALRPG
jgi:Selenocysteine lyase